MEERNQYLFDLERMIEDCETVLQLVQSVKESLVRQGVAMEGSNHRRPWVGDDVTECDTCTSVKRRILVCREMLLSIRKRVDYN